MLALTPVQLQHVYELEGPEGYKYTVYCSKDNEFHSWSASVSITTWGFTAPEPAIEALGPALKHLLDKINGVEPDFICDDPNCLLWHCGKCRQPIHIEAGPHVCQPDSPNIGAEA